MVEPGQVETALTNLYAGRLTWVVPTPSTFVESAITKLGCTTHTCGYWAHSFQTWILFQWLLPKWAITTGNLEIGKKQYIHAINMKKGD